MSSVSLIVAVGEDEQLVRIRWLQDVALAATSLEDLSLLEQLKILDMASKGMDASAEQRMALDRFADAFADALAAAGSRFSIADLDQLFEVRSTLADNIFR
jgi:hypothetical protein